MTFITETVAGDAPALECRDDGQLSNVPMTAMGRDTAPGIPSIDAPDIVLPSQLPALGGRIAEYGLLIALLDDAVQCFEKYIQPKNRRERMLFEDAKSWIMSTDEACGHRAEKHAAYFSFEYVCAVLSIDAASVRERLWRWRAVDAGGPPSGPTQGDRGTTESGAGNKHCRRAAGGGA